MGLSFKELIGLGGNLEEPTQEEIEKEKERIKKEENVEKNSNRSLIFKRDEEKEETKEQKSDLKITTSHTGTRPFTVVVIEPKSFDECQKLVDGLKARRPVVINLEKVETEIAIKIYNFLLGATYALSGNVTKIANNIFIFAPSGVDVSQNTGRNFDITTAKSWKDR